MYIAIPVENKFLQAFKRNRQLLGTISTCQKRSQMVGFFRIRYFSIKTRYFGPRYRTAKIFSIIICQLIFHPAFFRIENSVTRCNQIQFQ